MARMRFFYLNNGEINKLPSVSFDALRIRQNHEITLYPFSNNDDGNVFIYGQGWRKVRPRNKVTVPVFSLDSDDWNDYIEKYGIRCLFFSLTGRQYDSNDCCDTDMRTEFNSIIRGGVDRYVRFIEDFLSLHEIQREKVEMELRRTDNYYPMYRDRFLFRPMYYLFYSFVPYSFGMDPECDDRRMENFYGLVRTHDLIREDSRYAAYERLLKDGRNDEASALYRKISGDCNDIVRKEINTDNDVFPCSVKDRVRFLFGDKAEKLYTYLMDNFDTVGDK